MLKRIPIRLKLLLLAGVPVIGALILATSIARDARRQADSAAAIGSIEDLAHLAQQMGSLIHALQLERNELSLRTGQKAFASPTLKQRFLETDAARKQLRDFLAARNVSSLPPRLALDLKTAETELRDLQKYRDTALSGEQPIDALLDYYERTDLTLISATAALSQLAEDGELLRAISALVIVLQIKERASQEHALLSHVFAINEFPPGTFKDLVTLTTEEADYVNMLHVQATDRVSQEFKSLALGPEFSRTAELRSVALNTQDDDFHTAPEEWSAVQGTKLERLRGLVIALNKAVEVAAVAKVGAAARAVRLSYTLGGGVIALSALLAGLIARGISRSVASLAEAADQVSKQKNFGIRARKTSEDELGRLADAFNEMLSGIQARDDELRHHAENLEQLVEQRTAALQSRNKAMRLVLDNVEQGLATIEPSGILSTERSRAFDQWFGGASAQGTFAERLAQGNELVSLSLQVGWEQVTDGMMPLEASLDQMPKHVEVNGRRYQLSYKAIVEQEVLTGALLIVSDVTLEAERTRRDAEQRELIAVFERFTRDRVGFLEFVDEGTALVNQVAAAMNGSQPELLMRALHTLKGSCSISGVESVAAVAHRLESSIIEAESPPSAEEFAELANAWRAITDRVRLLSGGDAEAVVQLTHEELGELEELARTRAPHAKIMALLKSLKSERARVRLQRVAEQAKSLAQRLGKGELDVQIEAAPHVRFQAEQWAPFWSAFVHVVRNALDHGIESPEERLDAGKPARPTLRLVTASDAEQLTIEIGDDGRGIDWSKVAEKAGARGLPTASDEDLVNALFCDGVSTAEAVTDVSGRGVGMSAVRDAARALGGAITVTSARGVGTSFRFRFPVAATSSASVQHRRAAGS